MGTGQVAKFKIEYVEPNLPGEVWRSVEAEFIDWTGRATLNGREVGPELYIPALQWAQDAGYSLADKGEYKVTQL